LGRTSDDSDKDHFRPPPGFADGVRPAVRVRSSFSLTREIVSFPVFFSFYFPPKFDAPGRSGQAFGQTSKAGCNLPSSTRARSADCPWTGSFLVNFFSCPSRYMVLFFVAPVRKEEESALILCPCSRTAKILSGFVFVRVCVGSPAVFVSSSKACRRP